MHYRSTAALLLAAVTLLPSSVYAQDAVNYPSKVVRIIVPFAPGGSTDIQARLFAQKISENLRQPFIVDNRPSAGGADAIGLVAKATPDGYMLLAASPTFTVPQTFSKNLPDPIKDFAPISLMSRAPYLMVVHPSIPAKSVRALVALAKARPGKLNFGGSPLGSANNLAALWFFSLADIKATYVPFKGTGPTLIALMGGEIDGTMATIVSVVPHVQSGKLRALGVTSAQRSKVLPSLPTIAEQGVPGYDMFSFHGWIAPTGTPAAIVNKLSVELAKVANSPEFAGKLKDDGAEPVGSTPEQFRQLIAAEVPRWRKLVQDTGIKAE